MTRIESKGLVIEIDEQSGGIRIFPERQPHLKIRVIESVPAGMHIEACDPMVELRAQQFLSPRDSPAKGSPIHNDCCSIRMRKGGPANYPPISPGTPVVTTQLNVEKIGSWTKQGLEGKKWGVKGKVLTHHDSHGLCYDVLHEDGTEGSYDPTEIEVTA